MEEVLILLVKDIHVYIKESYILQGVSLNVGQGEIVCLLGRNGAGKTTTLRSILGYLHPARGSILFKNQNIEKNQVYKNIRKGIGFVPEDRRIFPELTVHENLEVAFINRGKDNQWSIEKIYEEIPLLKDLKNKKGGAMSGGEQQIVAIARALATNPSLLLLDEPCEGLAPVIVEKLGEIIINLKKQIPMLLAEQNAFFAMEVSDRGYVIDKGQIKYEGKIEDLKSNSEVQSRYLAV